MRMSALARWSTGLVGQPAIRPWLQASGSLTARLKARFPQFAVTPLREQWVRGRLDELQALGLPAQSRVWVRDVILRGDGQPRVFAHSVFAPAVLRGDWRGLQGIGQRPLGALLFATPAVKRGPLYYRKLPLHHPLRQQVIAAGWAGKQQPLWARRSLFRLGAQAILVTEVFLPQCAA